MSEVWKYGRHEPYFVPEFVVGLHTPRCRDHSHSHRTQHPVSRSSSQQSGFVFPARIPSTPLSLRVTCPRRKTPRSPPPPRQRCSQPPSVF